MPSVLSRVEQGEGNGKASCQLRERSPGRDGICVLSLVPRLALSLSKERVRERSSEDLTIRLEALSPRNSKRPLPPLAMLASTSPGTRRGEESCRGSYA